jgi:hypothetical protein
MPIVDRIRSTAGVVAGEATIVVVAMPIESSGLTP